MERIYAFEKLKQYANPPQQERFVMHFNNSQTQVLFEIDGEVIDKCSLQRILNVSDSCVFNQMNDDEVNLFLKYVFIMGKQFPYIQNCYNAFLLNLDR